jgi:hypothetical protein
MGTYFADVANKKVSVKQTKLGFSAAGQKTAPFVFAQLQSAYWGKNSGLRFRSKTSKYVMLEIEEETAKIEAQRRIKETVGYLAIWP